MAAGFEIRVAGGAWMDVLNVTSKAIRGLQAQGHTFELRRRDVLNAVSSPTAPITGTAAASAAPINYKMRGGSADAASPFVGDIGAYLSGGPSYTSSGITAADLTGVTDPAPAAVYTVKRFIANDASSFTYTFPVNAGRTYLVRLHHNTETTANDMTVVPTINGVAQASYLPHAAAGGTNHKGYIREYTVTPVGANLTVQIAGNGSSYAYINGIEILESLTSRISTVYLSDASLGVAYSQTPVLDDEVGTVTWSVELGTLPTGLSLNTGTGAITGTPTVLGDYAFILRSSDDNGFAYRYFTILVDQAPASYLLTGLAASAACAVGLRRLRAAYAGALFRVVRPSDSVELDINYDTNGNLDRAAVLAFAGGETLRVKTLYDQTGNGRHLTHPTTGADLIFSHFGGRAALECDSATGFNGYTSAGNVPFTQLQGFFVVDHVDPTVQNCLCEADSGGFIAQAGLSSFEMFNSVSVDLGVFEGGRAQISAQFVIGDDATRINGVAKTPFGVTNAGDDARNGLLAFGARINGTIPWLGRLGEAIYFANTISTGDRDAIEASQYAYYRIADAPTLVLPFTKRVILEGDSRTFGFNNTGDPSPLDVPLQTELGSTWFVKNVATSAQRLIENYTPQGAYQVDPYFNASLTKNVVVVWGIINDLALDPTETLTAGALYSAMTAYIQARQAAGFKVVVCTDLPTDPANLYVTANQANVIIPAYNALVISNAAGADAVVNFANDANLTNPTDLAYFTDGTHVNDAAALKMAILIEAAILSL